MLKEPQSSAAQGRIDAAELRRRAGRALGATLRAGAVSYDRTRDLPRLIRVDPLAPDASSIGFSEMILGCLKRALRAERFRARAGHWTYDLNRHIALRQAYLVERARLSELRARRS